MQLEIKRYVHPCETTGRLVEEGRGRESEEEKLKRVKVGGGGGGKVTYGGEREGEEGRARESGKSWNDDCGA